MVLILRFTVDSMFGDMCVSVKYSGALVYVVLILRLYSCWIEICSIGMCKKSVSCKCIECMLYSSAPHFCCTLALDSHRTGMEHGLVTVSLRGWEAYFELVLISVYCVYCTSLP